MAMPPNMILVVCRTMYIVYIVYIVYTCIYMYIYPFYYYDK